ncbi:endonuclease III [Desulfatibacillum aliphaticivorans]|uniref:endonuclease III n=1 Tax=Desulfatibacillum aliphaticivorans TaxID=218208 RepID=UPI00041F1E1C|nr:endonuclease III [Desulfatibacillum aliphaticivorans]
MPGNKKNVKKILEGLQKAYPAVKTQLEHNSPFQLLIATMLSAQCTDKQVNSVTPALFARASTPEEIMELPLKELEELIHATGFFHTKAKRVKECAAALMEKHGGVVPRDMESLLALPGVGRKTANVVLNAAFEIPGIVVDTHVQRISQRLGFTKFKDPVKIEFDLMKLLPKESWIDFSLHLIYHGRAVCTARKPKCGECTLAEWCKGAGKF